MRFVVTGLLLAAGVAGPANAAPFEAVDANLAFMVFVDQPTMARNGAGAESEILLVTAKGDVVIALVKFDCAARTSQQRWNRKVTADFALTPVLPANAAPTPAPAGTLAGSLLDRVCFNKKAKASAGWTKPTLGDAITSARQIISRLAAERREAARITP